MLRLLYISTARRPHTSDELDPILKASRRNNANANVTGLLLAGGRRFLQILEGDEADVKRTYERIRNDDRHIAVVILKTETTDKRMFPSWAMGYLRGGDPTGDAVITSELAALIDPIIDPTVRAYFQGFAQQTA